MAKRTTLAEISEKDLVKAFDDEVHLHYGNNERYGCPGASTLKQLAYAPSRFRSKKVLQHLGRCGACLDELSRLRKAHTNLANVV